MASNLRISERKSAKRADIKQTILRKRSNTDWYGSAETNLLVVTAGSKDEALAFIAYMSLAREELKPFLEQAVLVSSAESVRKIAAISTETIPIAYSGEAERELVTAFRDRRAIVVAEKNIKGMVTHITIDPPSYSSFHDALTEMGFDDAQIDVHASKSGKSPTILRRQLARMPAFKKPVWESAKDSIKSMIPLVFAGTWTSDKGGDKEILATIAGKNYSDIERDVAYLASLDDAPIWVEGKYRGIISKLDCFHAISDQVSEDDISNFFFVAEYVLTQESRVLTRKRCGRHPVYQGLVFWLHRAGRIQEQDCLRYRFQVIITKLKIKDY